MMKKIEMARKKAAEQAKNQTSASSAADEREIQALQLQMKQAREKAVNKDYSGFIRERERERERGAIRARTSLGFRLEGL